MTTGLFALGAYLARNLPGGWSVIFWLASLGGLLAMNVTVRQSEQLTLGLLFGFGLLVGLATAPTIAYYANAAPEAVWKPAGDGAVRGRRQRSPQPAPPPAGWWRWRPHWVVGLTAAGGHTGPAVAGVLAFRLLAFWLPILPGWLAYRGLRAAGTI